MRLLLVEDDLALGSALEFYLRSEGHVVDLCRTLGHAKGLIGESFDALLLDWNLPDGSGLEWLMALRARGVETPALVLTAHDELADRVLGLNSGADDFLVKPFAPEELSARVRAVVRRSAGSSPSLRFGAVQVDVTAKAVRRNGQPVEVTAREWAILEALVLRSGRIVSKQELESIVIGMDSELASNLLEVYISRLRNKLGKSFIETVRGLGYRVSRARAEAGQAQ